MLSKYVVGEITSRTQDVLPHANAEVCLHLARPFTILSDPMHPQTLNTPDGHTHSFLANVFLFLARTFRDYINPYHPTFSIA